MCQDGPMTEPSGSVREALLDAAYDEVVSGEWSRTRMADVARTAGVSRQTLYNEFGTKDALGQALTLREVARFLAGVEQQLQAFSGEPHEAVGESVLWTLQQAAENPLLKAVLTSARGGPADGELLAFITTRAEPVLVAARDHLARFLTGHWPDLTTRDVLVVAETVIRLTVSHLVLPTEPVERTAATTALLVARYLRRDLP